HHTSRNPRIAGTTVKTYLGTPQSDSAVHIRNNVFYAWGHGAGYGGENGVRVNFVNNYYKPSSMAGSKINIYESYIGGNNNIGSCIYANGNVMEGNATITKYNRSGVKAHNDLGDYIYIDDISDGITDNGVFKPNDQYIYDYPVMTDTAEEAYQKVIAQAGASLKRDQTDTRVINNLINGTLPKGRLSGIGFIDSQNDVGGWCRLIGGEKPLDSDNDGIPYEWEDKNGLDKYDASDSIKTAESGYINIVEYANSLVANANERTHLNKSLIYDEIDRTNKMKEEKYIAEYFSKEFEECDKVIATADSVLLDDELTNEKIKAKADELKEKNDIISESGLYWLLRAIDTAENIKYSAYTNITWDNLQNALKKGNELKDIETNDEELKNAAQSIYECIDSLEKKTEGTVKLAWYLDMKDKENKFDYNDEDWANFKSEISAARQLIYERDDIGDEEYNSIKKKIDGIYENIRKPYITETKCYMDFEDNNKSSKQEYGNESSFLNIKSTNPIELNNFIGTDDLQGTYQLEFSFYEENVNNGILTWFPDQNLYITDEGISQNEWHRMRIDFDKYSKEVYISIDGKDEITKMKFSETKYDYYTQIWLMPYTAGSSIRCIDDIVLKEKIMRTNTPNDSSWGDVDLDGKVTANDAALVQNYLSGKILLSDEQKYNASVLGIDNDITSGCAVRIL
ncbi:MAG: dockerin type I repeat-containing protein, partial [Firmicutes bacterium]|nr:dockerin type I repeat-containing protein [Bacillota bacterium]